MKGMSYISGCRLTVYPMWCAQVQRVYLEQLSISDTVL